MSESKSKSKIQEIANLVAERGELLVRRLYMTRASHTAELNALQPVMTNLVLIAPCELEKAQASSAIELSMQQERAEIYVWVEEEFLQTRIDIRKAEQDHARVMAISDSTPDEKDRTLREVYRAVQRSAAMNDVMNMLRERGSVYRPTSWPTDTDLGKV